MAINLEKLRAPALEVPSGCRELWGLSIIQDTVRHRQRALPRGHPFQRSPTTSEETAASIMDESPGFHIVDAPTGDRRADAANQEVAQGFGGDRGGLLGVGRGQ